MGLDCTAYSHLEAVGLHTEGFCYEEDDGGDMVHISAFVITEDFLTSMDGLPVLADTIVSYDGKPLPYPNGGCYRPTEQTEESRFHAGSYSGYGMWRRQLADQFNPYPHDPKDRPYHIGQPDPDKPFFELLWFADNEGTIGPQAAARLLIDFQEHEAEYVQRHSHPDGQDEYDIEKYRAWLHACELASQDGLIILH